MEETIYNIVTSKAKQRKVGFIVLGLLIFAVMMIPTKIVLAKMLPGKSANTFTVYIDTATNSTINQTREVVECVVESFRGEEEVLNMEMFLGQGAPLDYAGLVKGSAFKRLKSQAEVVVNLTDKHGRDEASFMMVHRLRPIIQEKCENLYKGTTVKFVEMPSGPPTFATIVVNLYGKDSLLLRQTSEIIEDALKATEGLVDIDVMQDDVYTKYEIIPNVEKIISSNLSVEQVSNILYMAFKGNVVATKNSTLQQDQIPIFVSLNTETRTLDHASGDELKLKLSRLKLLNRQGVMVPVKEVVEMVNPKRIIIALDTREGYLVKEGWKTKVKVTPYQLAKMFESLDVAAYLFTDVDIEGTMKGVNVENVKILPTDWIITKFNGKKENP